MKSFHKELTYYISREWHFSTPDIEGTARVKFLVLECDAHNCIGINDDERGLLEDYKMARGVIRLIQAQLGINII